MIPPPICKLMLIMFYNIFFILLQPLFVVFLYFYSLIYAVLKIKKRLCQKNMI